MVNHFNVNIKAIIDGNSIKTMKVYNIQFFDTMLYFASSLDKMAKNFGLNISKTIFPYKFVNKDNLYYIGEQPD